MRNHIYTMRIFHPLIQFVVLSKLIYFVQEQAQEGGPQDTQQVPSVQQA